MDKKIDAWKMDRHTSSLQNVRGLSVSIGTHLHKLHCIGGGYDLKVTYMSGMNRNRHLRVSIYTHIHIYADKYTYRCTCICLRTFLYIFIYIVCICVFVD